ncbi:EP300-interacting inhibitor of differentiation 3-like [Portunus trituberculatus]|uniref:EP300-interacting inhibitor of differentiation 3-like n=1 Tax=Portunus trituberculatus TaxID=210409 RepID=UPI001E1CD81D|nr:EP300-interacting inhibitor of differentiation 3-like [Portunus trituberculatus]XP_045103158.1 EP300-interacting inhibitor of differentiation 3-like [Portunus trituberculatus]
MMSGKKERNKQPKKMQNEGNGQEEGEGRGECSDSDEEEKMRSYLSEEANKVVREKYQDLMTEVHQYVDEDKNMDTHNLQMLVLKANEAFEAVKRPREAAIDSQLLKVCGNMAKVNIEAAQSSLAVFNAREFAEKLRNFAEAGGDNDLESDKEPCLLSRIYDKTSHLFNSASGIQPFFSAIEWKRPETQRKARQKKNSDDIARHGAQKVEVLKEREGEEEAEAVSWVYKTLKQWYANAENVPLPFFNFVVDPTSFSRTVENLFHVSLLVGELHAEIKEDQDGLPVILPSQNTGTGQGTRGEDKQCILSIDIEEWQQLIKAFQITEPMIKPRTTKRKPHSLPVSTTISASSMLLADNIPLSAKNK